MKGPVCAYVKVGGDDGRRITLAAFAVIVKYTENIAEL
jgi:hypothetical protein